MPKEKRRGKGNRADKEKPLLTLQGVLRLEKSFITAQHDDAQELVVRRTEDSAPEVIKLVPGHSEHDLVQYKAGYDVGPSNPNPQNEPEQKIFHEQMKVKEREEAFEEMKCQSLRERAEREKKFQMQNVAPPGTEDESDTAFPPKATGPSNLTSEKFNLDDPSAYELPDHIRNDPAFSSDRPSEVGSRDPGLGVQRDDTGEEQQLETESSKQEEEVKDDATKGQENQDLPEEMLPQMKPLPSGSSDMNENDGANDVSSMALSVALAAEEQRKREIINRIAEGEELAGDHDELTRFYSLDELSRRNEEEQKRLASTQGPELSEKNIEEIVNKTQSEDQQALLNHYWQFVKENPEDFNGWCYLIQQAENMNVLDEIRAVYKGFLELFPYCFAYWQRYSEMERKHEQWQRALLILHRGLKDIPLSIDLWISYLELYRTMYAEHETFDETFREHCERAIQTAGLEYRSDLLWEKCIEWELQKPADQIDLKWVTGIYRRLLGVPTRLYNKHWDNFVAHVRDHHPRDILKYEEYEELRRITCEELSLTYRPDPVIKPGRPRDVVHPEDKLKAEMKYRIVASVKPIHEKCAAEVEERSQFEDKIKRTYFHVKALDLKQLKNWNAYLDFEIRNGNHERIVVLFERCLIACACYEQFWAKYARYLERYYSDPSTIKEQSPPGSGSNYTLSQLLSAKWSFGTGVLTVEKMRDKRCSWTLRGWKETDKEGKEVMMAEEVKDQQDTDEAEGIKEKEGTPKTAKDKDPETQQEQDENEPDNRQDVDFVEETGGDDEAKHDDPNVEGSSSTSAIETNHADESDNWLESVRAVYRRACEVHCRKKAMIKLRWAAFEEENGNLTKAKGILNELKSQYPLLLECRLQLVDLERRIQNLDVAEDMYRKLLKEVPENRRNIYAWIAMKMARFQLKVLGEPERAIKTLRQAVKKDPSESRLYAQIIDICYQRQPVNLTGFTAAIELAISSKYSKSLSNMQKLEFVKRKLEFMHEFGDVKSYRDAWDQIKIYRQLCANDLKAKAKKKKELEAQEEALKNMEAMTAQVRAEANMKAKIAEAEGRLLCSNCQSDMLPDEEGKYEFERPLSSKRKRPGNEAEGDDDNAADEDGVVDLMDLDIPEDQEEQIKKALEEKTKYKEVAPTWELNMETYGYGKKRKTYDPDYEHVETAKFKEYERLEASGYDETLKDLDHDKPRNINAPGLGFDRGGDGDPKSLGAKQVYTTSDYVVPPKVPQLQLGPGIGPVKPSAPGTEPDLTVFELPKDIADPQKSPCVNVPEWFVKEGGELCLSDTTNGVSILRYWPKFLSEKGNHLMFNRLRKYCKWHQKQVQIGGAWKYETRLVAWYGPCDYNYSGLHLEKNLNWAPELLDLLHRLIAMTKHEFNSCFLNLYRHGHDMCGWHADVHPQLGRNPCVASVSLGVVRVFEFRRKSGPSSFIRFPLFPGSLLVMEGATQEDWLHCLPRDVNCKEERINLTFRTMFALGKR